MENPKAEAEAEQNPSPKLDSKESGHAPNGDGKWTSFVMGSESQKDQDQDQSQSEVSGNRTPSSGSRKSVHWSPELVTESSASNMHSPHGSNNNPYFSPSPVPSSSSFSVKGYRISPFLYVYIYVLVYVLILCLQIRWIVCAVFLGDGGRRLEKLLRRLKISLETRGSTVS